MEKFIKWVQRKDPLFYITTKDSKVRKSKKKEDNV